MDRGGSKQSALQGSMGQNNDPGLNSSVFADSFVSWWMHLLHHLTQVLVSHSAAFPSRVSLFSLWVLNSSMYKLLDQFKWEDIFMHKTTGLTATPKCKIRNYSRASGTLFPIMQCIRFSWPVCWINLKQHDTFKVSSTYYLTRLPKIVTEV